MYRYEIRRHKNHTFIIYDNVVQEYFKTNNKLAVFSYEQVKDWLTKNCISLNDFMWR